MDQLSLVEEDDLDYWNNWLPLNHSDEEICSPDEDKIQAKITEGVVFNSSKMTPVTSFVENPEFGNWLPPMSFSNTSRSDKTSLELKQKQRRRESRKISKENLEVSITSCTCSKNITWKKEVNIDWGRRKELHDASNFNDSDSVWGLVNLGVFGKIKLWINEYGNICGLAEGKISKLYSSETTIISINKTELIRKMLGLSGAQWASLCESFQEIKATLKFDAFEDCNLTEKTDLEKLWIFICKRRHFLPDHCMLVKLCGAVKCMRKLQITPKLLVLDIRNNLGEPIL